MNITAIPHRWYSDDRNDKSAVLVTFQAWSDTGRGTLIGYLHQTISVHGVMTSVNMVHAREWMKMVERNNLVLRSSEWEPSWFRAASTRTEERAARRATERKSRPMKEKETTISSPKLVSRLRVPKEKKPKLVTSPPREPKEKKPKVILRKRREGFSSLFDEE